MTCFVFAFEAEAAVMRYISISGAMKRKGQTKNFCLSHGALVSDKFRGESECCDAAFPPGTNIRTGP